MKNAFHLFIFFLLGSLSCRADLKADFIKAIKNQDVKAIYALAEKDGAYINWRDEDGKTALMMAVNKNDIALVKYLTSSKLVEYQRSRDSRGLFLPWNIRDRQGNTPLIMAVQQNNIPIVKELLSKGASPNVCNDDGYAPLEIALAQQNDPMAKELLSKGANPSEFCPGRTPVFGARSTPLMMAIEHNNTAMAKELLSKGADPNISPRGSPPPRLQTVRWLL